MNDDDLDPTTLPLPEQTALMDRDALRLSIVERELASARDAYQAHVVNGPDADIDEVRERRDALYGTPMRAKEAEAVALARKVGERARGIMTATASPEPVLSAGEGVEAGAFATFAEHHCRTMRLPELVSSVRAAVVAGNRPRMYAYAQYLPLALASPNMELGGFRTDPAAKEKGELHRLARVIAERLADPAFAPAHERARDLVTRASATGRDAGKRERKAYRDKHPFAFQSENDVKRWED